MINWILSKRNIKFGLLVFIVSLFSVIIINNVINLFEILISNKTIETQSANYILRDFRGQAGICNIE